MGLYGSFLDTELGTVMVLADEESVKEVRFAEELPEEAEEFPSALLDEACAQLGEYFAGGRKEFDLPLKPEGTEFQKQVWEALCRIPYGETRTYKEIAEMIGNPKACRAVGMANHNNPICIVIPCHRVVGADGSLTGYAGGLDKKKGLLDLEQSYTEL